MVRQIQTGRHSGMPDEMVRGRASRDLSTGLRVVVIKVDAREADARAQLRQGQPSAKEGWLENGITGGRQIQVQPITEQRQQSVAQHADDDSSNEWMKPYFGQ